MTKATKTGIKQVAVIATSLVSVILLWEFVIYPKIDKEN
jgi:hypothetical protein